MESGPDRAARQRREWMLRRALAVSDDDGGDGLGEADAAEVQRNIERIRLRKARRTVPVPIRVVRDPKLWR
jgi:hypothetical protein